MEATTAVTLIALFGIAYSSFIGLWCSSKFKSIKEALVRLNNQITDNQSELKGLRNQFNSFSKKANQSDFEKTQTICNDLEWQVRALKVKTGNVVYPTTSPYMQLSTEDCYELKKDIIIHGDTYKAGEKIGIEDYPSNVSDDSIFIINARGTKHQISTDQFLSMIVTKQDFEARLKESEKDLDTALEKLHDQIEVKELFEANDQKREEIKKLKEELRLANEKIKKLEKKKTR